MTTATNDTIDAAARRYLDEAAAGLDDLPLRDREELVSDIADAIAESGGGTAVDYATLVARLGAPDDFARELRVSSGAAARPDVAPAGGPDAPGAVDVALRAIGSALRWAGTELEPLWWVVRALAVVMFLVLLFGGSRGDAAAWSVLLLLLSLAWGVAGRVARTRSGGRGDRWAAPRGAALVGLGLLVVAGAVSAVGTSQSVVYEGDASDPAAAVATDANLHGPNGVVSNVYAFDADGNRLNDVRLYDQDGAPLDVGASDDPDRRRLDDARGGQVMNAVPIRYVEPGTDHVDDPDAGWPASPGPLADRGGASAGATPADPSGTPAAAGRSTALPPTATPSATATATPARLADAHP
ncbi:MAG: dolichyl-phosphate-mannose--protein O-mannosyl transferase [Thermoleophilia bacterium]|nr:dolichyl-phosphate-mannose--protein O-mannosyl transferase [Thermoleophilia bacterium]